jgi:hypothetical protein
MLVFFFFVKSYLTVFSRVRQMHGSGGNMTNSDSDYTRLFESPIGYRSKPN